MLSLNNKVLAKKCTEQNINTLNKKMGTFYENKTKDNYTKQYTFMPFHVLFYNPDSRINLHYIYKLPTK